MKPELQTIVFDVKRNADFWSPVFGTSLYRLAKIFEQYLFLILLSWLEDYSIVFDINNRNVSQCINKQGIVKL